MCYYCYHDRNRDGDGDHYEYYIHGFFKGGGDDQDSDLNWSKWKLATKVN